MSVLLADYLLRLHLSGRMVGAIVTGTMLGSAALTIGVGLWAHRLALRRLLVGASLLMCGTGLGFAFLDRFLPLFLVAVVGTLNPSAGDVSLFLPTEQAAVARSAGPGGRTLLFAWYNLLGTLAGALGALASGLPGRLPLDPLLAERVAFLLYAGIGLLVVPLYAGLSPEPVVSAPRGPLTRSRSLVFRLAALFSLDSFGGGFVVQSLLVLWLKLRFQLSAEATGAAFFLFGALAALSQFISVRLASRIGLVKTMVFTHLPANLLLIAAGVMPTAPLALLFLTLRAALSSMDVPARQSYVMAVVPPEERAAAASLTNVPRSLAAALPPYLAGLMLEKTSFGWPLLIAGALKAAYDLLLLAQFQAVHPREEGSERLG